MAVAKLGSEYPVLPLKRFPMEWRIDNVGGVCDDDGVDVDDDDEEVGDEDDGNCVDDEDEDEKYETLWFMMNACVERRSNITSMQAKRNGIGTFKTNRIKRGKNKKTKHEMFISQILFNIYISIKNQN